MKTNLKLTGSSNLSENEDKAASSEVDEKLRQLQGRYDELNRQMDILLTESMERSNRIFMASEIDHLITNQVFNASNDGIWAIDRNRKIMRVNRKLLHIFNKKPEQIVGRRCSDFFPEECPLDDKCPWQSIEKGEPIVEQELPMILSPENSRYFRVAFTPLFNLDGDMIGLVETFTDITERRNAEEELQRVNQELEILAGEDGLTKLSNRRRFNEQIELEWRRQMRTQKPVSLIMCDVDFFKRYNDTYGHQAGDACLTAIAGVIKRSLQRGGDMCARYGGEEFAIIMGETDMEGAMHVVRKIYKNLGEMRLPHRLSDVGPYVTISCGIASVIPRSGLNLETLIETADQRLYRAKRLGRNCVVGDEENLPFGS